MKYILRIIGIFFLFTACNESVSDSAEITTKGVETGLTLTEAQAKSAGIELGKLEKRSISKLLKLNGKIDVPPQNLVSVSMPLGGFLKSTQLLPGMHVKKGEVIATMEDQQYIQLQQDYLTAKAELNFLESEYMRQRQLNESKASSDKVFQQTEMEYSSQKIVLNSLAEKLRLINIVPENLNEKNVSRSINLYSSIDGYVSRVNVNIGKYVNPTDVLFELINPADIHLNLTVFEKDLDLLSIGQKVLAYSNHQPDKKHLCEIILISQNLSPDRSAEVHCHFDDYHKSLFPGMYMNAEIEIKLQSVDAILETAIVGYQAKDYIFISTSKNQFTMLEVVRGDTENGFSALNAADGRDLSKLAIVTKGSYSLLMQLKNKSEE